MKFEELQNFYLEYMRQVQQVPVVGSMPLTIAGKIAGYIHPRARQALQNNPHVTTHDLAVHIAYEGIATDDLNAILADIAIDLRNAGCTRAWRNELLNVYGEGKILAKMERAALRPLGLLTSAVHLNGWSEDLKIYLSLRSLSKANDPGKWDTLVGGLLNAGDTPQEGLLRESFEEAGLAPDDIKIRTPLRNILRMRRQLPEGYQLEDILVSDCLIAKGTKVINQDGEVAEIKLFDPEQVISMIQEGCVTLEAALVLLDSLVNRHIDRLITSR